MRGTATPQAQDDMTRAMLWMSLSGLSFALMAASVKSAGTVPVSTKVFFRNLVTLLITTAAALRSGVNPLGPTPHLGRLLARSLCGLGGVFFYFLALGHMHLADASLLNKTSPFFVMVFAVLLLKESFNRALLPALALAFVGSLLILKPRFGFALGPALAGLASGLFAGMAYTLVRSLQGRENPTRIIFYFSLVSTLAMAPLLFLFPGTPDRAQWVALLGTGVFAAGGQYGMTIAYHHARASRISVFSYLHVFFALVVGYLLWHEVPDRYSLGGGLLIIAAAIWTHRLTSRERPADRRAA